MKKIPKFLAGLTHTQNGLVAIVCVLALASVFSVSMILLEQFVGEKPEPFLGCNLVNVSSS